MGPFKLSVVAVCSALGVACCGAGAGAIEMPGVAPQPASDFIQQIRNRYDPSGYYRHHHRYGEGGYHYRRFYGGGLRPYGANTVITAPPGSAGAAEQRNNRRYFCEYAPSRC